MNDIAKFEFMFQTEMFGEFSLRAEAILNIIQHNQLENTYLTDIRDTLLPKLMSGELDVSELDI